MNRLFLNFVVIIIESNAIVDQGAKELAEALKLNKNLTELDLGIYLL